MNAHPALPLLPLTVQSISCDVKMNPYSARVTAQLVLMESVFACLAAVVAAADSADAPLYLPYKALVSTISNMVFNEAEAHRIIEILSEKAGIIQDTWHTVRPL